MTSKSFFVEKIIEESGIHNPHIFELACGTATYITEVLKNHTDIWYVGLEPDTSAYRKALTNTAELMQVEFFNQLGYGDIEGVEKESFDVVFSLSALEHIKDLTRFIEMSARYLKPGGLMVHRYDLGHALHSSSLKERLQVFLGNTLPWTLPENKFVRYVGEDEVRAIYDAHSVSIYKSTYHQMTSFKEFEKHIGEDAQLKEAAGAFYEWEWDHAESFGNVARHARERLFPSIALWGKKNTP